MNPTNPQPVSAPTPPSAPPVSQPPASNKKIWLIGGGILAIIALVLIVWMMGSQKKAAPAPEATVSVEDTLEKELNTVNVQDIEADLQSVDQDLQNL